MKSIFVALLICVSAVCGISQKSSRNFKTNIFYAEAGGKSPFWSVNYERILWQRTNIFYSASAGFTLMPDGIGMPFSANIITGKSNHHIEIGLGVTPYIEHYKTFLAKTDLSDKVIYISPGIGYRYQKPNGGIFLSVGLNPLAFIDPPSYNPWDISYKFYLSGHADFGYNF